MGGGMNEPGWLIGSPTAHHTHGHGRPNIHARYRYSPRWDAKRMARELVAHAIEEASYEFEEDL